MANIQPLIDQLNQGALAVLILDDDPNIAIGLQDVLEDSGFIVDIAMCAEDARDLLQRKTFSVMISDYNLPGDNGVSVSREAKRRFPHIGLILMTGNDPSQIREKLAEGEMRFLRKPVEVAVLLAAIEDIIERQCDALRVKRKKSTAPETIKIVATPAPSPIKESVAFDLDDADPMPKSRTWTQTAAWGCVVLLSVAVGWAGRGTSPTSTALQAAIPVALPTSVSGPMMGPPAPRTELKPQPAEETAPPVVQLRKRAPSLVSQLSHEDPAVRLKAAKALLKTNSEHPEAVSTLVALITESDAKYRLASVQAFSTARTSTPDAISTLARTLSDQDPSVVYAAATALGHLGAAALPARSELLAAVHYNAGTVPSVTQAAQKALANLEPPVPQRALANPESPAVSKPNTQVANSVMKPQPAAVVSLDPAPIPEASAGLEGLPDVEAPEAAAAPAAAESAPLH